MTITLRATKGSALTIAELDANFTDLNGRVVALESSGGTDGVGVADISQDGSQLTFTMTDATTYVFTFAGNGFAWRGEWVASDSYVVDDVVTVTGSGVYLVLKSHTADGSFDPDAVNGSSEPLYALMLADTGGGGGGGSGGGVSGAGALDAVPLGGTTGQVLTKDSGTDFDYSWQTPSGGGTIKRAMVTLASDTARTSNGYISWDTEEYDTDSIHNNSSNKDRLTVPSGASLVRVGFTLYVYDLTSGSRQEAYIACSNFLDQRLCAASGLSEAGTYVYITGSSGPIPVSPGDYFHLYEASSDGTRTIGSGSSNFWLEVLE